jgi:hypothetical protein
MDPINFTRSNDTSRIKFSSSRTIRVEHFSLGRHRFKQFFLHFAWTYDQTWWLLRIKASESINE